MTSLESDPRGGVSENISTVDLTRGYIRGIHTNAFDKKLYNPLADELATKRLLETRHQWGEQGKTTIFTSGAYDLEHLDHSGYLLHVKASGAGLHYERTEKERWDKLLQSEKFDYTSYALSNQALKLIVSVDGDDSIAVRKGYNPEKGGGQRPILGWRTRALDVARESYISPADVSSEAVFPTVDAVTMHGPDDFAEGHTHAMHFDLVEEIQPDGWVIFGESVDILEGVEGRSKLASVALLCIEDDPGVHYHEDTMIGKMSTTNIVKRAKG